MKIYCALLISLSTISLFAQTSFGPKLLGMGNNSVSVSDIWAVLGNPAGISHFKKPAFALAYQKHLFSNEISTQAFASVFPFRNNFIGLGAERYGFSAYNELKTGLTFSKLFGENFSIGIKTSLHQLKIASYGSKNSFSVDAGVFYQCGKQIALAAYISNITNQQYVKQDILAPISAGIHIGGSYLASDKILIAAAATKIINQNVDVALGIDYKLFETFSLRGGISINPFKQYAGFGINYLKFRFNAASAYHSSLGYSPQIGIAYEL